MFFRKLQPCSSRQPIFYGLGIASHHVVRRGNWTVPNIYSNFSSTRNIQEECTRYSVLARKGNPSFAFRQFTVTSSAPDITKHEDVLGQIAALNKSRPSSFLELPAIVVFTTPSFATWLENEVFVSRLLEVNFDTCSASKQYLNVSALFAVVDSLPSTPNGVLEGESQSMEGFAIITGEQEDCLPELLQSINSEHLNHQLQPQPSSLFFKIHQNSAIKGIAVPQTVRVPLANTLFQNGRVSTLLASSWQRPTVSAPFRKAQQIEKKHQGIRSFVLVPSPRINIPLTYLTPPRRITSSLGNIVRRLMGVDDKLVSASQELEASIDTYLENRRSPKGILAVWALVIRKNKLVGSSDGLDSKIIEPREPFADDISQNPRPDHSTLDDYVGFWLRNGASLHRVLSGGGGWGIKQGIVSLDPDLGLMESADGRYNFDSSDSFEGDQVEALGNIAEPGSWIQFLAQSDPTHKEDAPRTTLLGSLILGCIPSTVGNIPRLAPDPILSACNRRRPIMRCFDGHFGAQSEKGIYVYSGQGGEGSGDLSRTTLLMNSKIDVPNTTFWWPAIK